MSYKKYTPSDPHTYAFGMFPTLEALTRAPHLCRAVLYESRATKSDALTKIEALCEAHHIPFLLDEKTVSRLSPSDNTFVMTVVDKPTTPLAPHANHLVLVSPSDMGNLGTIFRTALGFGMTHIALIQPCADYHDPRAVRASMGAIFSLNIHKYPSFEAYRAQFPSHSLYPTMTTSAIPLASVTFPPPYAVIFGNESAGLPPEFATIGQPIVIPHTNSIDSLNLAVAVGIVLYHTSLGG
jgi:TrmH family RNA methyltransferase